MSRPKRDSELRVGGLHISTRFALIMTLALTLVMSVAALSLYSTTNKIARTQQERTAVDAVKMLAEVQELQQRELDDFFDFEEELATEGEANKEGI